MLSSHHEKQCHALARGLAECSLVISSYNVVSAAHWWLMPTEAGEGGCLGCGDKPRSPWLLLAFGDTRA